MMAEEQRRGLGRGLSALIGDDMPVAPQAVGGPRTPRLLPVAFLKPNRFQPRRRFAEEDLADLVNSIREKGLLQPILVRPIADQPENFEIVAGERRWRAAQAARLHDVPVVIREMGDAEALEFAIVENVQRADLNAVEEATAYHELMDRFGYTQEKIAQEVGKSRSHIANSIRLLKLPEPVKTMIREGQLTAGHARTLIGDEHAESRAREIVDSALNVREAEQRSKATKEKSNGGGSGSSGSTPAYDPNVAATERELAEALGLKVQLRHKERGDGELRIQYRTPEQLDEVIRRLRRS
jgi:ParB family transcriptional regulator, chromosome partitioning protein